MADFWDYIPTPSNPIPFVYGIGAVVSSDLPGVKDLNSRVASAMSAIDTTEDFVSDPKTALIGGAISAGTLALLIAAGILIVPKVLKAYVRI